MGSDTKKWMKKERARAEKEKMAGRKIQERLYAESQKRVKELETAKREKEKANGIAFKKAKAKATVEKRKAKKKTTKKKIKKVRKTTQKKIKKARSATQAFKNIFG